MALHPAGYSSPRKTLPFDNISKRRLALLTGIGGRVSLLDFQKLGETGQIPDSCRGDDYEVF